MVEEGANGASPRGFRALWRGELSLEATFWVFNVVVHSALNAVLAAFEWWGGQAGDEPDSFRGAVRRFLARAAAVVGIVFPGATLADELFVP